jgi:hypothetical protein
MTNTWAKGLNPEYHEMSPSSAELFVAAVLIEQTKSEDRIAEEDVSQPQLIRILEKRLSVFKLPIVFTPSAKMAALALAPIAGAMVVLLIDCLNAFEGKTVTATMLAELYPIGFYDDATLHRYVEDFMKPRRVKWADVYIQR